MADKSLRRHPPLPTSTLTRQSPFFNPKSPYKPREISLSHFKIGFKSNLSTKMDLQSFRSKPMALKCPRCDSLDTKFCYYNNYNYSQPRHFCKSCRRYWTIGGVLRNIPVGGRTRKSRSSKPKPASPSPISNLNSEIEVGCVDGTTPLELILSGDDGGCSWFKC